MPFERGLTIETWKMTKEIETDSKWYYLRKKLNNFANSSGSTSISQSVVSNEHRLWLIHVLGDEKNRVTFAITERDTFICRCASCKLVCYEASSAVTHTPLLHTWLFTSCITFWKSWEYWGRSSLNSRASLNVPMLDLICILDFWISANCYKIKVSLVQMVILFYAKENKIGEYLTTSWTCIVFLLLPLPSSFPVSFLPVKERPQGEKGKGKANFLPLDNRLYKFDGHVNSCKKQRSWVQPILRRT